MKTYLPLLAVVGLTLASLVSGCANGLTPAAQTRSRINEKTEAFNKLTPLQQGNILGGAIERGNTPDMVYMALGQPKKIVTSADGHKAMWVYVEYYAANSTATTSANNPNSRYSEGMTMVNEAGPINPNLPAKVTGGGGGGHMKSMSMSSTGHSGPTQSLSLPDLASNTVYVFFSYGKVAEIKFDGDIATQSSYHVPPAGKKGLKSSPSREV